MGTDGASHLVEGEALVAAAGGMLVVVLPWCHDEKAAFSAGFHSFPSRLGQVGEAILLKYDEWKTLLEGWPHDGFLAWGDRRGNEHRSASTS